MAWRVGSSVGSAAGRGHSFGRERRKQLGVCGLLTGLLVPNVKKALMGMATFLCPVMNSGELLLFLRPPSGEQSGEGGRCESFPGDYGKISRTQSSWTCITSTGLTSSKKPSLICPASFQCQSLKHLSGMHGIAEC